MDASIFLRLDDVLATVRPIDAAKSLNDLDVAGGLQPATAAAINAALGSGTFNAGWLCDELAGNLAAAFGAPALTAAGSVTYGAAGPLGGTDTAVGASAANAQFDGGANFDVAVGDDLIIAWVGRFNSAPTAFATLFSKVAGAFANGWVVSGVAGGGAINFAGGAGAASAAVGSATGAFLGEWHVGIAALDRAAGKLRIGTRSLTSGLTDLSTENAAAANTWSVADTFKLGSSTWTFAADTNFNLAGLYIGKGAGVAAGVTANLSTALGNFATALLTRMPTVIDGVMGRARSFLPSSISGFGATDIVAGSTLLNRDCSVQAIIKWDLAGQNTYGVPGTIIARGRGNVVAEYVAFGLELRVVNVAANVGELRWFWHDLAGVLKTQIGGHFTASSGWLLITATRRWVSPTECTLRYYVGDELLAEVTTADGSIGGGTTGTTTLGTRYTGATWGRFLAGAIDELRVVPRELTAEEVAATWNRITLYEPLGYTLIKELHAPGFPISKDPSSRVQKETRMWGQALGFAAAQAENVRDNILPDRAYGKILERWEDITKQSPKPGDSIDTRRARVVGRLRQRAGVSIPGASAALKELVATDPSNLQFLSWDQTIVDAFTSLDLQRWDPDPSAQWTINANTLRVQAPAGTYTFDGPTTLWYTCPTTVAQDVGNVGGSGTGARILTKLTPTLLPATSEVGVYFGDIVSGNYLLLGLRFDGAWKVVAEGFRAWVSQGLVLEATLGGMPASIWFHLWQQIPAGGAFGVQPATRNYSPAWSTTSALSGYTVGANISHLSKFQWAGYYLRSVGAIASAVDVALDDLQLRTPSSDRPFHWYVYRDPALPGKLDLIGANNVIRGLKHAYTDARVITSKSLLYDDAASTFDAGPAGAI